MDYSVLAHGRKECFARYGTIYAVPITRSPYDYLRRAYRGGPLLDVGAGNELYVKDLLTLKAEDYFSLDTDPSGAFTYRSPAEIPGDQLFTWIVLNQVVEHLAIDAAAALLADLRPHLAPAGELLVTTPNVFHPVRYWADPTHLTPWGYTSLYALACATGYQVTGLYRYSKNRGPRDPLSWLFERLMRRIYRIDWCDSIMLVASC